MELSGGIEPLDILPDVLRRWFRRPIRGQRAMAVMGGIEPPRQSFGDPPGAMPVITILSIKKSLLTFQLEAKARKSETSTT